MFIRWEFDLRGEVVRVQTEVDDYSLNTKLDESIADEAADAEVQFAFPITGLAAIVIVSDRDITVKTNDAVDEDLELVLKADVPYVWHKNSYEPCIVTVPIETLFVSNDSGGEARLRILAARDATP